MEIQSPELAQFGATLIAVLGAGWKLDTRIKRMEKQFDRLEGRVDTLLKNQMSERKSRKPTDP